MNESVVIIPTYNEKDNIEAICQAVLELSTPFDLLIIDDNSPDGTAEIVKELQKKYSDRIHLVQRSGKLGLGTAYIVGFKWSLEKGYKYICEMDADFSHNPNDLVELHKAISQNNYHLAVGSRYINGVAVVNWPMKRILMSYYASSYVRTITGMPVKDTTAGFVCYNRKVLETIDLDSISFKGYAFQIEMKFRTWKHGFKIIEVPIIFTERRKGKSKMSGGIFNEAFWGVIIMKLKSWFKPFKKANFEK